MGEAHEARGGGGGLAHHNLHAAPRHTFQNPPVFTDWFLLNHRVSLTQMLGGTGAMPPAGGEDSAKPGHVPEERDSACQRGSRASTLPWPGLSLGENKEGKRFVTPTETNVHGDALCSVVMGRSLLQRLAVGGWRLVAVGGWWRLAVGGWWSLGAVLDEKAIWVLKDSPGPDPQQPSTGAAVIRRAKIRRDTACHGPKRPPGKEEAHLVHKIVKPVPCAIRPKEASFWVKSPRHYASAVAQAVRQFCA